MYGDYDVYRFAIESLDVLLKRIIVSQKEIIKYHQSKIDEIKKDPNLSDREKQIRIKSYLSSIQDVHNLLKQNNNIINHMSSYVEKLHTNINNLITGNLEEYMDIKTDTKEAISLNNINKVLFAVIEEEHKKIIKIKEEAKELLTYTDLSNMNDTQEVFEKECRKLYHLKDEVYTMISCINITGNDETSAILIEYIDTEKERIKNISEEAYDILGYKYEDLVNSDKFDIFFENLRREYNELNGIIDDMDYITNSLEQKNLSTQNKIALNLYQNIVEDVTKKLTFTINILDELFPRVDKDIESIPVLDEDSAKKDEIVKAIDEENRRLEEYSKKIRDVLENLKDGSVTPQEVVARLSDLYISESQEMETKAEKTENIFEEKIDPAIKEKDTIEYKKMYSLLNKSFWTARQKALEENIKYPSALFEKTVKEYQNEYLIEEHNISLDEVEDAIEEYKDKYASDIYMDDIYNQALSMLKEESLLSVQELCDESNGISMLDKKAYELLEKDLIIINEEIDNCDGEVDSDFSRSMNEYKKNFKINKLMIKKDIIEHQMYLIKRREKRLENGYF